jgi:tRNA A-37 threonylcarbamoyl transferase component Bud32
MGTAGHNFYHFQGHMDSWAGSMVRASPSLILARLQQYELINIAEIEKEGVRVSIGSRSHSLHFVSIGGKRRFAVKSASRNHEVDPLRLNREALIYRLAAALPSQPAFLPLCHLAEGSTGLLILNAIDGPTVHTYMQRSQPDVGMVCHLLGQALGMAHRDLTPLSSSVPPAFPWILNLFIPGAAGFIWGHPYMRWLLEQLPNPWLWESHLMQVRHHWRAQTLMHGDLKWDNCVLYHSDVGPKACLIDWELAGWGDPAWDLACLIQEIYTSLQQNKEGTLANNIHILWTSYCVATRFSWQVLEKIRQRIYACVAARLLHAALEEVKSFGPSAVSVQHTLHLANILLMNPASTIHSLDVLA